MHLSHLHTRKKSPQRCLMYTKEGKRAKEKLEKSYAKGQQKDRKTAEEMGANAFLTKPFANQDVIDMVRTLAGAA